MNDSAIALPCTRPENFPFERYFGKMAQVPTRLNCVDIGCGYGDFVAAMSRAHPEETFLGMEIRDKAVAIAQQQLLDIREKEGVCENAAVIRCNCMRQLPRVLARDSLDLLTIMYPDPQFKAAKENRRIVSTMLVSEYAYYLRPATGVLCTCTDVPDLGEYMRECVARNGNFALVCETGFGCGQGEEAERVKTAL